METSSKTDIRNLSVSFKNLAAPPPDATKPLDSRSGRTASDHSGSCNEGMFIADPVPFNEVSNVNSKQTAAYVPVGGKDCVYVNMSQFRLPSINEGSKVNRKQSVTDVPNALRSGIGGSGFVVKKPSVLCNECSKEHPPCPSCPFLLCKVCQVRHHRDNCPSEPCEVCSQYSHRTTYCPYFRHIPQGATFDRETYELLCTCGNLFSEAKWVCTFCTRRSALLKRKHCSICDSSFVKHSTFECPKDEVRAAASKSVREEWLRRVEHGSP